MRTPDGLQVSIKTPLIPNGQCYVRKRLDMSVQMPGETQKGAWIIEIGDEDCIKITLMTVYEPIIDDET